MTKTERKRHRPSGYSSRVRKPAGQRRIWAAPNGQQVRLPLIVDHVNIDGETGVQTWLSEAKIDLVDDKPELVSVQLKGNPKLNPLVLQRFFRWATPLEVVRITIPSLLEMGINPFEYDFPTEGFPDVAHLGDAQANKLSDEFLKEVARQYVEIGRGYASTIAEQRGVSPRTVVSWVEKARKRGFLEPTKPGKRSNRVVLS